MGSGVPLSPAEAEQVFGDPTRSWPVEDGFGLTWVLDPRWRAPARIGYGCRFGAGRGRRACGAPAVAEFHRGGPAPWWAYCAEHLYSYRAHDDVVYHVVARRVPS